MTDFNFKIPSRYDETVAAEGAWTPPVLDEYDNNWGEFKTVLFDGDNPSIKRAQERAKVKFAKEIRLKKLDSEKVALEVFIDAVLIDWKGIVDGKGKEVPFSKEAARAYFDQPQAFKFVFPELLNFSADVRNFTAVDKDEVLGN